MEETRAKIVCTLGPSSNDYETIKRLVLAGMDVARLNFSHGTHENHEKLIRLLREVCAETGKLLAIMMDLQGPKIRVGTLAGGGAELTNGSRFTITMRDTEGNGEQVSTTYKGLVRDVSPGDILLLDDGMISLRVESKSETEIVCEVTNGGYLSNNKGINIPGASLSVKTISKKDLRDVEFALSQNVDFLAMSFVRRPSDVEQLRRYLTKKNSRLLIVTKIEKPQAMDYIDEIISVSDGIMVARGDLGVEMPTEQVPGIQKVIISKCNKLGVPVITATQMLDSMIHHPRPTRAEASDVANAILDGSDAVMLSGESAAGKYPVQSVEMMNKIIDATEGSNEPTSRAPWRQGGEKGLPVNEGIAISACTLAEQVDAKAIVCITLSGSIARAIARYRPAQNIYAISQHEHVARALSMIWGIRGVVMKDLTMENIDDAAPEIHQQLNAMGILSSGDRFVLTAGLPFSARKATNMLRVDEVP
ncbi:MAG: pyruvate kinase [SAR324 cluster bacterium]|nr:pyruvate kinase [SAR324 cluster bacterium]